MRAQGASTKPANAAQRRAAVRTALIVGGIAVAVYVAFLLSGVLGS
jgi:CHASE3 domain sensor protein